MSESAPDPFADLAPQARLAVYRTLQERFPLYWSPAQGAWVVSRYADVSALLRHPDVVALDVVSFFRAVQERGKLDLENLCIFASSLSMMMRPPRHDLVRRLLAQALGNFRRSNLPLLIEDHAQQLLNSGAEAGGIDLALGYGRDIALFTIGSLFGIPREDTYKLGEWGADLMGIFDTMRPSMRHIHTLNRAATAMSDYFMPLIAQRRACPGDDALSNLIRLNTAELACSDRELAGFCSLFFIAAEENTGAALSAAAHMLTGDPGLRGRLRGDPARIPDFVRESLRLSCPVKYVGRQAGSDIELHGETIGAGTRVVLMLAAANRDPKAYPDPDRLDIGRSGPESLSYSAGPYRCIGVQLANLEIEIVASKLLEWPRLELAPEPPEWYSRMNTAGLRRLPAIFANEA